MNKINFSQAVYTVSEQEGSSRVAITLNRSGDLSTYDEVSLDIIAGSAQAELDYYAFSSFPESIVFDYGEATKTIDFEIFPDNEEEGIENLVLAISSLDPEVIGIQNTATLSIIDDDVANIEFSQAVYSVNEQENSNFATITLNRTGNLDYLSRVQVEINGGSANLGEDYESSFWQEVTFNPGETTQTINVEILPDYFEEGTESIDFSVSSLENAFIANQDTATLKIIDDEIANVGFAEATYIIGEGDSETQAIITLVRSGNLDIFSEVRVEVTNGSAEIDNDFFVDLPESIIFDYGEVYQTLKVEVGNDYQLEGTESITFAVTSLESMVEISGNETTTVSIVDSQSANIEFSQGFYSVTEDDETLEVIVPVTRSGNLNSSSEVQVNVVGGSAFQGEDYYLLDHIVYFEAGQSLATLRLEVNPDYFTEGTESINFALSSLDNAVIGNQANTTVEIIDNDVANVQFAEAVYLTTEEEEISQTIITLTRSGNLDNFSEVEIDFTGSAVLEQDFDIPNRFSPTSVTFNPGETIKSIGVDILPDWEEEGTELVNFTLASLDSNTYIGNQNSTTLFIQDDDVANIEFSQAVYTVTEGDNNDYTLAEITLTRTGNLDQDSQVKLDIIGGSAEFNRDYYLPGDLETGNIYFYAGETTKTVLVEIDSDNYQEGTELANFALTSWDYHTVIGVQSETELVIYDEDVSNFEFGQTVYETSESNSVSQVAVTINRSGNLDNAAQVAVNWMGGDAKLWDDFYSPLGYLDLVYFSPEETQQTFLLDISPDTQLEGTELANFLLSSVGNSVIGNQGTTTVKIQDDDVPTVEFSQAVYETKEEFNNSQVAVSLTRSGNISIPTEVQLNLIGGDAQYFQDYDLPRNNTIFFDVGETVKTFFVDIKRDVRAEGTESIVFSVTSDNDTVIGSQDTTTVEIIDDDATTIAFSQANYVVQEAQYLFDSSQAEITLVRSGNLNDYSEVIVEVAGGSADQYSDYEFFAQAITFQPGETQQNFLIDIPYDREEEGRETVDFTLINLDQNTFLGTQDTATLNIFDAEVSRVEFAQASYVVTEDDNANQAAITLKRSGGVNDYAQVGINLLGGSATLDQDYEFNYYSPEFAVFEPGQIETTFWLEIIPDAELEEVESVSFSLVNLDDNSNYNDVYLNGQDTATLFIYDNETAIVEFETTDYFANEEEETSQAWLTLTRTGNIDSSSQVQLNISGGSAQLDQDYSYDNLVYFEAGETYKTIPVNIVGDSQSEGTESVFFSLTSIDSRTAIALQNQANLSIFDDDVANVEFSDAVYIVSEDENNPSQVAITLTRTGNIHEFAEVQVNVTGGSANSDDYDWSNFSREFDFASGEVSKTFWLDINPDTELEGTESIQFSLMSVDRGTEIGIQDTTTVFIKDDDASTIEFAQSEYIFIEENETTNAIITFTRTGNIHNYAEAIVNIFGGSAKLGEDYSDLNIQSEIFFEPGEVYTTFNLEILPDTLTEGTETVHLSLTNYQNNSYTFIGNQDTTTLYIQDDEVVNVEFADAVYTVSEGKDISQVGITLTRSGNLEAFTDVQLNWVGGDAQLNQDYEFEAEVVQFLPGETIKTVLVDILTDFQPEGTEEASFLLTSRDENVFIGSQDITTLSIQDRDLPYVEFSEAVYTANEGDNYPSQATITLARSGNLAEYADVEINLIGGSAVFGTDYDLNFNYPEIITFQPGETIQTFSVDIFSDGNLEGTESILFSLTSQDEQTIIGNQDTATVEIIDHQAVNIEFSQAFYTTSEHNNQAFITLTRNGGFNNYGEVFVEVIGGDAQQNLDYNLNDGFLDIIIFEPGELTKTFAVDIFPDANQEGTETVTFYLYTDQYDAKIGNQNTATLAILDDEVANVEFADAVYTTSETEYLSSALITLTRTGNLADFTEVQVNLSASNAQRNQDYDFIEFVTFEPGENQKVFPVEIFPDYQLEGTESVTFSLASTDNQTVIGNQNNTTLHILDDEVTNVEFAEAVYTISETENQFNYATITVNRSGNLNNYSDVEVFIIGGNATQEDFRLISDYGENPQYLNFEPGETTETLTVEIESDWYEEGTESVLFSLVSRDENTVIGSQATTTLDILDSQTAYVEFSQAVYTTPETETTSQTILTLERSGDIEQDLEVQVVPNEGTASLFQDYILPFAYPESIFFAPGETTKDVIVEILPDTEMEGTELVNFSLLISPSSAQPYALVGKQNTATLSILDDDVANIEFSQAAYTTTETEDISQAAITLTRSGNISSFAQVEVEVMGGNAQLGADFDFPDSVTFAPGETDATLLVNIFPDNDLAGTLHSQFTISTLQENTTIGKQNSATLTILDDEASYIAFEQTNYSTNETQEINQASITLTRSGNLADFVEVQINLADGTATFNNDYHSQYGFGDYVYFEPGETLKTFSINILPDGEKEGIETLNFSLNSLQENVIIANQNQTTLSIVDDDIPYIEFSQTVYSAQEARQPYQAEITVTRTGYLDEESSVYVEIGSDNAQFGVDYISPLDFPSLIDFAPGETEKTFLIEILPDEEEEGMETIDLYLSNSFYLDNNSYYQQEDTATLEIKDLIAGNNTDNFIQGSDDDDVLGGGGGNDVIEANGGSDRLNGGTGDDTLVGGTGDDNYTVDSLGDIIVELEGEGNDTVISSLDWQLGEHVENITLRSGTNVTQAIGNELDNRLIGNEADNILEGKEGNDLLRSKEGADTLLGGSGDDRYILDDLNDTIIENQEEGYDTIVINNPLSGQNWQLADHVEVLVLKGTEAFNSIGNSSDNRLLGNPGNNIFDGQAGNDTLMGKGGEDYLIGGAGDDLLKGDSGQDILVGVNPEATIAGFAEVDTFFGGGEQDLFILGDANQVYYDDQDPVTNGTADYVWIRDFELDVDQIQLHGDVTDYVIGNSPVAGVGGKAIFLETEAENELIAVVRGNLDLNLHSNNFTFVS